MIRDAAAALAVLCLAPSALSAQEAVLTIVAPSAEVHKAPSIGSPVIGTARRGAALEVTRNLGSWVSVTWPSAPDGEAFVHVSRGSIARPAGGAGRIRPASVIEGAAGGPSSIAADVRRIDQRLSQVQAPVSVYTTPAHTIGLGGSLGGRSISGLGASGRVWRNRLGVQLGLSRDTFSNSLTGQRLTAVHVDPSVLYSPRDHVSDFVWLRPYAGGGPSIGRRTVRSDLPGFETLSATSVGMQTFGGAEFTFATLPRLAVSADLGYRWMRTSPQGFDVSGPLFSLAAHWYLK